MKKNKLISSLIFMVILFSFKNSYGEIIILSSCNNQKDGFIKNEYILDFEKSLMIRNFVYDNKTYKKLKLTDLSIKKENSIEKFIYKHNNLIFTDKVGYPQFYTQLLFEKNNLIIKVKTVINNEEGLTKISTCNKVEVFEKES